jgi:hypothetical protein
MGRFSTQYNRVVLAGIKQSEEILIETIQDHAVALMQELYARTPKAAPGTSKHPGLLRSSWITSLNAPATRVPTAIEPESEAQTRAKLAAMKVDDKVFISNPQPYALRIEHGWGVKNPPSGFVRPALLAYESRLKKR